ncbi:MAG: aldolase [Syntrophaceae bacterium CG2_30_49_12]|nr:MAG: aldolase [Syntrophaceae bacterium CG2_30_49_12]PIP05808.1 MAG: aldolase [Syntrophobacterales bacterium CG23_combo_of_CG06-09_8_20_14_all_48_27]PJA49215.1 MAG: aldolase [Syntrophobacterales bacterium CG_4_9_14_3_um_filter_49_8]
MIFENTGELKKGLQGTLEIDGDNVRILDEEKLQGSLIDALIYSYVFSSHHEVVEAARWLIRRAGASLGVFSASIQPLYEAMGRREVSGFTVPAINIRGLTYDVAQAVIRAAMKNRVGPFIFEIARSEIGYTFQRPAEYTVAVTAAAIKTGYRGPLFIQGDHFQVSAKKFAQDPGAEVRAIKDLIWEAIEAGFYNIDIDTSTLVDLKKPTVEEQQKTNYTLAAELTTMIRDLEPAGVTISVGGEIGEVGGKNSTVEELRAFMNGYLEELEKNGEALKGISKISVQTGTTHGGVPLPDGSIAKVKIAFATLEKLSEVARTEYGLAGAVQHGASTLPDEAFDKFPAIRTAEIHLATGFQNIIYDSQNFPTGLKDKIYHYLKTELAGERKEDDTEEQFIYKTHKKGFGPFKRELWHLPPDTLQSLGKELEDKLSFLFHKLNVVNTEDMIKRFVKPMDVTLKAPPALKG